MAKSQYKEIGDAILAEISSVAEAGRVHSYQRWSADLGKYLDLFRWEAGDGFNQIRGWVLTRESRRRGRIHRLERDRRLHDCRPQQKNPYVLVVRNHERRGRGGQ